MGVKDLEAEKRIEKNHKHNIAIFPSSDYDVAIKTPCQYSGG
jgi:hypothetical protein